MLFGGVGTLLLLCHAVRVGSFRASFDWFGGICRPKVVKEYVSPDGAFILQVLQYPKLGQSPGDAHSGRGRIVLRDKLGAKLRSLEVETVVFIANDDEKTVMWRKKEVCIEGLTAVGTTNFPLPSVPP